MHVTAAYTIMCLIELTYLRNQGFVEQTKNHFLLIRIEIGHFIELYFHAQNRII